MPGKPAMRIRAVLLGVLLALEFAGATQASPKLLLTSQRLRRLEKDSQRGAERWTAFEQHVKTDPDVLSLALYHVVTGDAEAGKRAIQMAREPKATAYQRALVADWCEQLTSFEERSAITQVETATGMGPVASARDQLFLAVVRNGEPEAVVQKTWPDLLARLQRGEVVGQTGELYALAQYLDTVLNVLHKDLRMEDQKLFIELPSQFLLSMKPAETDRPSESQHLAALALVTLDPNLASAQFLQGWAMQDNMTVKRGAGTADELIWANPYLPGLSVQNGEPWFYSDKGLLYARSGWDANACWMKITAQGVNKVGCPANLESAPQTFSKLTIVPATSKCYDSAPENGKTTILWKLAPRQAVKWSSADKGKKSSANADAAGMFMLPLNAQGEVCVAH